MSKWITSLWMVVVSVFAASVAQAADAQGHPVIPEPSRWAGAVVIVILGMFLAAAVVGIMVRDMSEREAPDDAGHHHADPAGGHH